MPAPQAVESTAPLPIPDVIPSRWMALGVLLCATFMNLLDVTIVNIALPPIQSTLGASNSEIEWIVAVYVLVFALALLPAGRLGDRVGKKPMFLIGVAGFTIASGLCGIATGIELLIAARFAQGLMAAAMIPQVLSLTHVMFHGEEQGRAFSLFGVATGLATVSGPIIGGVLIGSDLFALGWRSIFLINLPIGIFAFLAGVRFIPSLPPNHGARTDPVGIGIVTTAMALALFPLIEGRSYGWPAWCFVSMASVIPLLLGFVFWERRRSARSEAQLLPFRLMTNRNFILGGVMAMALSSTMPGFFLCAALFFQLGFGFSPLDSGLATVPFSVGVLVTSLLAGRLGGISPKLRLIGGISTMAVGILWLRAIVTGIRDGLSNATLLAPLLLAGLGFGIAVTVLFRTVLSGVPHRDSGAASGSLQALQQLGGAFGVAISSELFFATLGTPPGGTPPGEAVYADAFAKACWASLAGYALAILAGLMLRSDLRDAKPRKPVLDHCCTSPMPAAHRIGGARPSPSVGHSRPADASGALTDEGLAAGTRWNVVAAVTEIAQGAVPCFVTRRAPSAGPRAPSGPFSKSTNERHSPPAPT